MMPTTTLVTAAVTTLVTLCLGGNLTLAQPSREMTLANCLQGMEAITAGDDGLQTWTAFFKERSRRATLVGKDVIAVEAGDRGTHFWVVVLTASEAAQREQRAIFQFDQVQDILYLTAVPMTEAWMGMGCLHETVHARDILEGQEPRSASHTEFLAAEVRAFQVELTAADHLSRRRFSKQLRRILKKEQYEVTRGILIPNDDARAALDRVFPEREAASPQERAVRDGFYVVALNFAQLSTPAERVEFLDRLY